MITIEITADITLRDIALAAYRQSPAEVDFVEQPDGTITFTDGLRPGSGFAFGDDSAYGADLGPGVAWSETESDGPLHQPVSVMSGGCDVDQLDELVAALTEWIDRVPTDIEFFTEWDGEEVDLRTLSDETLADMRAEAGVGGDHELVRSIDWTLRTR